jgi:hypothetical protein
MSVFSIFWTTNVVGEKTMQYKQAFNDSSNAIRMFSNVYCINHMLDNAQFILYGYDEDVFEELGISKSEYSMDKTYYINDKYRLVQPHEEVINTLLKEGLLFTLSYYWIVCRILSNVRWNRINISALISYFWGSLVLAAAFRDFRLIAFLIVISADSLTSNVKK